ncbi:MAG: Uma2 family endonuclease [Pyrinomonadaceae bacterium]
MLEVTVQNSPANAQVIHSNKISFEDFLVKYDGQFAEWIDGEAILTMSASDRHQDLVRFFTMIIGVFVEENDLGVIRTAPLIMKLAKQKRGREPDLLFVSKRNLHRLKKNYLDGAADLVIEIISPESRGRDRGDKFYEYEGEGVKEYWLIDYERRQAEFYNLDKKGIYQFSTPDENNIFHSRAIKNLELKVDWLWQEKLPTLLEIVKGWNLIK